MLGVLGMMPSYQLNGYNEGGELVFTADVPQLEAAIMRQLVFANPHEVGSFAIPADVAHKAMPDLAIPDPAPALFLEDCAGW